MHPCKILLNYLAITQTRCYTRIVTGRRCLILKDMVRVATTPDRLREAMAAANKKQIDLAQTTGLSHSTISRYLSGQVEPRQEAIIKLASVLNVSEWWLWGYNVPMARPAEAKKNDEISNLVKRLRADPEFLNVVSALRVDPEFLNVVSVLGKMPEEEYNSFKMLILSRRK